MSVIYIVVPLAFVLAGGFLAAFLWSVRKGQFDDMDSPSVRMLFDEDDLVGHRGAHSGSVRPDER